MVHWLHPLSHQVSLGDLRTLFEVGRLFGIVGLNLCPVLALDTIGRDMR